MMNIELSIPEDLFVQFITNKYLYNLKHIKILQINLFVQFKTNKLAKVSDKHRLWLPTAHVGISKEMRKNSFELHQIVHEFPCELFIIFSFSEFKNFRNGA